MRFTITPVTSLRKPRWTWPAAYTTRRQATIAIERSGRKTSTSPNLTRV
jgi:hypothetical protein